MSGPLVLRQDHGPVVVLTLNRAEKRNALSRALMAELGDALSRVELESRVRAIVLTGEGPVFCAGMDLKEAAESGSEPEAEKAAIADVRSIADLIAQLHASNKVTIAALNGDAYAGGAGLALTCDFVIAADSVKLGYPEVRRGLVAAVVMHDLVRQVGERRARALLLSGEPIGAAEAERWGLINKVVPRDACLDEAVALGRSLVAAAPGAVAATKRLIDETSRRPADLRGAAAVTAAVRVGAEADEGLRAFVEKRRPRWAVEP